LDILDDLPDGAARDDDRAALRELIHKTNNYLSVVVATTESALSKGDPAALRKALDRILDQSQSLARTIREARARQR
jgi:two-component sensor histidine kinase